MRIKIFVLLEWSETADADDDNLDVIVFTFLTVTTLLAELLVGVTLLE